MYGQMIKNAILVPNSIDTHTRSGDKLFETSLFQAGSISQAVYRGTVIVYGTPTALGKEKAEENLLFNLSTLKKAGIKNFRDASASPSVIQAYDQITHRVYVKAPHANTNIHCEVTVSKSGFLKGIIVQHQAVVTLDRGELFFHKMDYSLVDSLYVAGVVAEMYEMIPTLDLDQDRKNKLTAAFFPVPRALCELPLSSIKLLNKTKDLEDLVIQLD